MKILYLANNLVGLEILKYLKKNNENIVGMVVHPYKSQKFADELINTSKLDYNLIFNATELNQLSYEDLGSPDICLSVFFGYILKTRFLNMMNYNVINIHPGLLPYNRGKNPNVWSIIDETPAGVTMHYIDKGIDTGKVIALKEVPKYLTDTGKTLYERLEIACIKLFKEEWPIIKKGWESTGLLPPSSKQPNSFGTAHKLKDLKHIDYIDLSKTYLASDIINIIRARTFYPYNGAYIKNKKGQKIFLRLELYTEKEKNDEQ